MNSWQAKVLEFHKKFGCHTGSEPGFSAPDGIQQMRLRLIEEELEELEDAILDKNITEVADALGDLAYVVVGCALTFGIDLDPIFTEIHRTNMLKEGGATRSDGKILKPQGWLPPQLEPIVKLQQETGIL